MRLLLVEKQTCLSVSRLCDARTFILCADQPDEALSILRHETFDLVLLDVTSFAAAGFALIRRLRSARNDTPLVALTGGRAEDRVRALSLGADDAISQPAEPVDLQARIAAVSRRHKGYSQSMVQVGALSLSLETRDVRFQNIAVRLTPMEYAMLELLVIRKDQVVTKDMFLSHLYNGIDEPEIKIIDVFVCKLRKKLNRVGAHGLIRTVWGCGYIFREKSEELAIAPALGMSAQGTIAIGGLADFERGYAW